MKPQTAMRILVVAPQPFFSPRGTPFSVYYRTLVTAQMGARIDLLTYGQGQDVDIPGVRIIRIPRFAWLGPVKVGPSLLKLFLDVFMVIWTVALLLLRRYDVVHAHEEAVFFCRFLKPLFRFKLIYDMHSSLPQQLSNFRFTTSRLLIRLFEALENSCLRKADAVITICPDLAEYAVPRMPDPSRHFLIENSIFDDVRLRGAPQVATVPKNGAPAAPPAEPELPSDRPLVVYAGTFESYQGLDILLPAFAEARKTRPDAMLVMVGGSRPQVERYRAMAEGLGLNGDCVFTGQVAPNLARRLATKAAVLVSPRSAGTNTPLKIYEQLASGIPLVATRIHSHTQVLTDDVCILVPPEPRAMAQGMVTALSDERRRGSVSANARALYEEKYSRAAYEAKMRRLLDVLR